RFVVAGTLHTALQVVRHDGTGHTAEEFDHARMGADPLRQLLAAARLRVREVARSQDPDEDLRLEEYLAGGAVDDRDRLTREVDEDLLAGLVLLAQHPVQAATPPAVALTEVAVLQPGRVRFLVLEPEQMKRHARTALRLH